MIRIGFKGIFGLIEMIVVLRYEGSFVTVIEKLESRFLLGKEKNLGSRVLLHRNTLI